MALMKCKLCIIRPLPYIDNIGVERNFGSLSLGAGLKMNPVACISWDTLYTKDFFLYLRKLRYIDINK